MRLTNFKIESLGYETFEGFTKNENWNGRDCPYFTFEQAQKVLKTYNELRRIIGQTNAASYDSSADAFVFPLTTAKRKSFPLLPKMVKNIILSVLSGRIWEESGNEQLNKTS